MRTRDLVAGDLIKYDDELYTFIATADNPIDNKDLVILHQNNQFTVLQRGWDEEIGYLSGFRDDNTRRLQKALEK